MGLCIGENIMVEIRYKNQVFEYPEDASFEMVAKDLQEEYEHKIALCMVDGKITELMKPVKSGRVEFITIADKIGHKAYVRTAIMMMIKALRDILDRDSLKYVKVEFTIGQGYYCSVHGDVEVDSRLIDKLNDRMNRLVKDDIPISKKTFPLEEGMKLFDAQGMDDKRNLFKYRRSSTINIYRMDDYYDYFYGFMLPSTSYIQYFQVISYEAGIMLVIPNEKDPEVIHYMEPREKLFNVLDKTTQWAKYMDIETVGQLNEAISQGYTEKMVLVQEAFLERRVGEIAREIYDRKGTRFVMIAGPSSSGKTSFSMRLEVQLRTYGLKPHTIAVDNYFVNRENTPKDEAGNYNFECLEALDLEQFNKDMSDLLAGKTVEIPDFNFKTGKREYKGNFITLGEKDILVIEGIHCLNDKMSYALPTESKFKVYISALTTLNVDYHNRIPTTDARLLRRMVRDARTRGTKAKDTIKMWPSVRKGEEENIFPFQESADAVFNSIAIYELAVLKAFAEPLLYQIQPEDEEYYEAKRLLKFLEYFLVIDKTVIPNNAILREFVGGSVFPVG